MKRTYLLLLISMFAVQIFASELVLIPTKNFNESTQLFKNPALTVNFYRDEFLIATLDGGLKMDFILLDQNPWQENVGYFLVYLDKTVNKMDYTKSIEEIANVLYDGGNYMVLSTNERLHGQLPPAKNDGIVRISNKKVVLPAKIHLTTSGRLDPDPFIVDLLDEVSATNIIATVQHLQDYGTRNAYQPSSIEAQNWIKQQFEDLGLPVELQDFNMPSGPASDNVIATFEGTKYPDEYIVMGCHYDSYSYAGLAPGADDNATGVAGVLEIARILTQYEFDRTLIFCTFSGEEYGLYGSEAYADRCAQQGMNIHGYLNMDMTGYLEPGSYIHTDLIRPASASELGDFYTQVCATYLPDFPVEPGTLVGGDSDHTSFNNAGYMGIFPFEDGSDYSPYIHTSDDVIGTSVNNAAQAAIFTQAILATAVSMANLVTPPQNLVAVPGDSEVDLQWSQMFEIDNYNVYRDGLLIASPINNSYLDQYVENGTAYEYFVTAIYTESGEESDPSNVVYATPMPPLGLPLTLDFENGAPYWDFEDTWGVSTQASHSPSHSITESPTGNYGDQLEIYATLSAFSLEGYTEASVSFWTKWSLESGYDYMWFEISTNGSNWTELEEFNGTQTSWVEKTYSLNTYLGQPYVLVRFHFYSDYSVTQDGMYIDDFQINAEGGMLMQNIQLSEGWTSLSSYIVPEAEQIEDVLSTISNNIVIVQNMSQVWWPLQGVNTIGSWDTHSGYKIKLSENSSLQIAGYAEAEKSMMLTAGWNLMPVLSSVEVSCNDLFDGQMDDLIIIKELAGMGIYWPGEEITTLESLSPTKAYLVKVADDMTISFEGLAEAEPVKPKTISREGWTLIPPTANSHVMVLPASLLNIFEIGDQIGVFTNEDDCVGYAEIENYNDHLALIAYGNDSTTLDHDGMNEGEVFNFRMYRSSTNLDYSLIAGFDATMPNQGNYADEGLSKLETLVFDNTGISEISNRASVYPNPVSDLVHVNITKGLKAQLEILNLNGRKVMEVSIDGNKAINTGDFPKGIYTFRIAGDSFTETHKVILQ
ncbi:MAG: M28 family peptidase [Bacteroidales bacterium]|nr:M28 family peptidase [Bacteroidales bacterium]